MGRLTVSGTHAHVVLPAAIVQGITWRLARAARVPRPAVLAVPDLEHVPAVLRLAFAAAVAELKLQHSQAAELRA